MSGTVRAFAPGRVNLIGEHTDYNGGLALPFAIAPGVTATARGDGGGRLRVLARGREERDEFALADPGPAEGWRAYVRGIAAVLGVRAGGELELSSDLPEGRGLSSSAAVTLAAGLALLGLESRTLEPRALARAAQRVEHEWAGAQTGLLDQLAILTSTAGHATLLDLRTLTARPVPVALPGCTFALLDSGERHGHAESGYNARRRECAEAAAALGVDSLRDADPDAVAALAGTPGRRARHVLAENERVEECAVALAAGDAGAVGALLDAAHASLRDLFEVSTPAVEVAAERLREAGALGARLVGGGFGGAVLGLFGPGVAPPAGTLTVTPSAGAGAGAAPDR